MKRAIVIIALAAFFSPNVLFGQDLKQEVYEKINIPKKKPIPYLDVREADVMWSKVVWRMIDLREKMNLCLYYPLENIANRKSLVKCLYDGIKDEGLVAYNIDDDYNEFKSTISLDDINSNLGKEKKKTKIYNDSLGYEVEKVIETEIQLDQVKQLLLKEKWFFDKQHSVMCVRIIGICPIRVYNRTDDAGNPTEDVVKKKTFWIYYPEARALLTRHDIYNSRSDAQHISFDDLFMQRRFSSYIFATSNEYNNRNIASYALGINSLYEAEKVKQYLFEMEHDLWEY